MTGDGGVDGLLPHHRDKLTGSAVDPEVAAERGYRSVETQAGLHRAGFSPSQAKVAHDGPALVIPIFNVLGDQVAVQMRPDEPRALKGRRLKYETTAGSKMVLDVPARSRPRLDDPAVPLWITEGPLKADAAVTAGLCCVALLGVWSWRGTNAKGGKVALPDFEVVALNGRRVVVAFDSDVMLKASVHEAMARLADFLKLRGANVGFAYLPPGPAGEKVGLDDFLAGGHGVGDLNALVTSELRRPAGEPAPKAETFDDIPDESGWQVLDDVVALLVRFVAFSDEHQPVAIALWAAHTWALDAADTSARLVITSPEKRSGKSRVLEVLELLVRHPERSVNVSLPFLFRSIEVDRPTVLFDEIDTIFGPRAAHDNEPLRGLIDAGYRAGSSIGRMVGEGAAMQPKRFPVFTPTCLAGIGALPDTIVDRAIVIELRRRAPDQVVERFHHRRVAPEAEKLRRRLAAWAARQLDRLAEADPAAPAGIIDRAEEVWTPLLAIADAAGATWPELARQACANLNTAESDSSPGVQLLKDIRTVFGEADKLASVDLVAKLVALEESPWGDIEEKLGKPINARWLARRLRPFGVRPGDIRLPAGNCKGYDRSDFTDAWSRYLPPIRDIGDIGDTPGRDVTDVTDVTDRAGERRERTPPGGRGGKPQREVRDW